MTLIAALVIAAAIVICRQFLRPSAQVAAVDERQVDNRAAVELPAARSVSKITDVGKSVAAAARAPSEKDDDEAEEPLSAEEKAAAAEEKLVDDFDDLTDKWTEPATNGVKTADVMNFVAKFARVSKDRKEECLQRALNLVPDENVMLLVGVLMDKNEDQSLVELVFNDILNRDEAVKAPILRRIQQDKQHPCHKDAAWLLDAEEGDDVEEGDEK